MLVLQVTRRSELLHHSLLIRRELVGNGDVRLDDHISLRAIFFDPLSRHAKALARRRALRNPDRHLLSRDRAHAHLRAEHRLRDVERHLRDDVESIAREETVRLYLEGDDQITRRTTIIAATALPGETHARARFRSRRHGDVHRLARAHLTRALARRARLRGHLPAAEAHGARTIHGESALAEGDHPASIALGALGPLRARRAAASLARRALLGHFELHGHLPAQRRGAKGDGDHDLDALALLRPTRALRATLPRVAAEHRREQIAEPAEAANVEVFHARTGARVRAPAARIARARTALLALAAEAAERAEAAHVVVLFALLDVTQDVVRLGNFLEAIGGLRVALVRVRMVFLGETAVCLFDLVLRRRRRHPEDLVVVLALGHVG